MNKRENTKRKSNNYDGYDQALNDPRLVDADFVQNQGLSAKATDFSKKREAVANDAQYAEAAADEVQAANEAQYYEYQQAVSEEDLDTAQRIVAQRQVALKKKQAARSASSARGVAGFTRWIGVGIAGASYMWQFAAAALSLVGIGMWGVVDTLINGNFFGRMLSKAAGWFNIDLQGLFPVEYLAMGFWALAAVIALCTFFGFLIWFYVTGVKVFDTPVTALVTALTFACSILPVANLFPWVLLWVIYMNVRTTAASIKGMAGVSG